MGNGELRDRLEELFSQVPPEPEPGEKKESPLEEIVVASLLAGKGAVEQILAEPAVVQVPPSVPAELEEGREREEEVPPTGVPSWKVALGKRRVSVLNILLYGVIVLGGIPLVLLLVGLIGQKSAAWSGFHTLYCAAYTGAVVVTLIQWLFNSSLTGAVREAEEKRVEAVRSQALLEERMAELATAGALLQRRALQFQTAAQVCHAITPLLDLEELVQEVVDRVCDRFDFYYTGLLLIDESGRWVALQAGTGEAGPRMVAQGYRLGVESNSVVSRCVASSQARIAVDIASAQARLGSVAASAEPGGRGVHLDGAVDIVQINPLLPETRSELALPLLSHGRVIGVLDIHSAKREAFSEEDVTALQMMADQVTAVIENALMFAETQARLAEMEELEQSLVREQRSRLRPGRVTPLYERTRPDVPSLGDEIQLEIEQAMARREMIVQSDTGDGAGQAPSTGSGQAALVAPISLRGQVIGALGLQEMEGGRQWTDDEIALIEAIADQMALAIENARLIEATQRRAERERLIAEISARVRASLDPDTILKTTVQELGRVLGAERTLVEIVGSGRGDGRPTGKVPTRWEEG